MISRSASAMALVPFVSVENMMRLILGIGIEQRLTELTEYVEADFRHWDQFDRKPRVASHSSDGVIELMPTFDGVGFAIEGFSSLRWLRERFRTSGYFQLLDMIADPDDPRNLYGMVWREKQRVLAA